MAIGIAAQVQNQRQHRQLAVTSNIQESSTSCNGRALRLRHRDGPFHPGKDIDRIAPRSYEASPVPHRHRSHLSNARTELGGKSRTASRQHFSTWSSTQAKKAVDY